jgi:hypothetical protein
MAMSGSRWSGLRQWRVFKKQTQKGETVMIATSEMVAGKKLVGPTGFLYSALDRQPNVSSYVTDAGEMVFSPNWTAVVIGTVPGSVAEADIRDGFVRIGAIHSVMLQHMSVV